MSNEGGGEKQAEVTESGSATGAAAADFEMIYFYYIKKNEGHSAIDERRRHPGWDMQVFLEPRPSSEEPGEAEIRELISAADAGHIRPRADKMADLTLRHKAYMLFVWKEDGRKLNKVDFIFQGDLPKKDHSFGRFKTKNLSAGLSYVSCLNLRLKKDGGPLGCKSETFDVRFVTAPPLPEMLMIDDETTTNTGP